jgi:hypothetical protein
VITLTALNFKNIEANQNHEGVLFNSFGVEGTEWIIRGIYITMLLFSAFFIMIESVQFIEAESGRIFGREIPYLEYFETNNIRDTLMLLLQIVLFGFRCYCPIDYE